MNLPKFEMVIDESLTSEVEVSRVAFVDKPAIEKNFMAFKEQSLNFAVVPERRIVSGPAMVPDMLIYRRDEQGEYNVFFSRETIEQIALKFFKKDYHKNLNLFHDPALTLDNVTIFESFQSDKTRGVMPMKGYEDLPDGTWFISAKIQDDKIWNMVKAGTIKGFSVEGIFSYVKKQRNSAETEFYELLNRTYNADGLLNKNDFMATVKEMFAAFNKKFFDGPASPTTTPPPTPAAAAPPPAPAAAQPLAKDYTLKDGTTMINISELKEGGMAMAGGVPCAPGEYELQDGTKITVGEGGLITAVVPATGAAPEPPQFDAQFKEIDTKLTAYEQRFSQYDQKLTEVNLTLSKVNETMKGMAEIVGKLAELPTAAASAGPTNGFSKVDQKEEKLKELAKNFQKLKSA